MTHVVTESCIKCKYMECVQICPASCFHEGENMVVIDPNTCIDCGLCVSECPAEAIVPDTKPNPGFNMEEWVALNKRLSGMWPVITMPGIPPADADDWLETPNKLQYLSKKPGKGD